MMKLVNVFVMLMLLMGLMLSTVTATSVKMDFLPYADVRVDPIVDPGCLADHVHTFYGGVPSIGVRPETTFQNLREGTQNSGNVVENKSMYWMPTVYRVDTKNDGTKRYVKAPIWFSSAYYVWDAEVKDVKAFPEGLKMIAMAGNPKSRTFFECVDPSPCKRGEKNCRRADPETDFPRSACWELEVSIIFPSCWDGVNVDSDDHMSHVAYTDDGFADGECPESHPVSIPQIHWYWRINEYEGGRYEFSNGSTEMHVDYFSGWREEELQRLIDECVNDSLDAMPDAWCEDHLTFRDMPKRFVEDAGDNRIVRKLTPLQPSPRINTRQTVTPEKVDNVKKLKRGACKGLLWPQNCNQACRRRIRDRRRRRRNLNESTTRSSGALRSSFPPSTASTSRATASAVARTSTP